MKMEIQINCGRLALDCLPPEILTKIFSFLDPDHLVRNVSKVCSTFSCLLSDEAYWKIRIFKRWPSNYPPIPPTLPIDWVRCTIEREQMNRRYNKNDLQSIIEKDRHYSACDTIIIMPNKERYLAISGSRDKSLVLWDVKSTKPRVLSKKATAHNGWVWGLSADGPNRLSSCGWDNVIRLWDLSNSSLDLVSEFDCGKPSSPCLDISFVNNVATVGTFNKKVMSFDLRCPSNTNAIEQYLHHSKPVLAVHVPKRREELLLSASEDGSVVLIDRRAKKLLDTFKFSNKCYPLCMDMIDGDNCLYVGDKSGNLHLIEIGNGCLSKVKCLKSLHKKKILDIHASRGGIVTCSADKSVKILQPDISMNTIAHLSEEEYGEVTAVSHWKGVLALAHSEEGIRFYDRSDCD